MKHMHTQTAVVAVSPCIELPPPYRPSPPGQRDLDHVAERLLEGRAASLHVHGAPALALCVGVVGGEWEVSGWQEERRITQTVQQSRTR